ncbi:MAG: hypothetical protein J4N81_07220 [Chloroflexi bacterium]|nr:hypothetical protein [Chloroflexota bacterium]
MSIYAVSKIFYMLENDASFRERIKSNPIDAIEEFSLSPEEREALTSGDVQALFKMGVHAFLLNGLSRHQLFGVTRENYFPRIRGQESPR